MADLTVIILTKNEEVNIEKCIRSLRGIARRIAVIDSGSTDRTAEIAKECGAEVFSHPFRSHAEQFNWAAEAIRPDTEWIMKLDADEELTEELAREMEERLDSLPGTVNGVILRRRVYFMGRWLRHGGKYPELLLRIFRTGHGASEMKQMDEHLILHDGEAVTFRNDFLDMNNKPLEWWIAKHNWYSGKEVYEQRRPRGEKDAEEQQLSGQAKVKRFIKNHGYYSLPLFFRAHLYYLYRYYLRLGFLDGKEGKIYTFLQAYWYRYLVDAKLYECDKNGTEPEKPGDLKT